MSGADGSLQFESFMRQAAEHKKKAQWELAENCLKDAEALCTRPRFPNAIQNQIKVQLELAEVTRRHGNYKDAIKAQEKIVKSQEIDDTKKCKVYGELGVNYRHTDKIKEAAETFEKHYDLSSRLAFEMDAEACRAVGNLAISKYQMYLQLEEQSHKDLLLHSICLQQERVDTAKFLRRKLQDKFAVDESQQQRMALIGVNKTWLADWTAKLHMWESIGVSRLVLPYIANEQPIEAINSGEQAVDMTKDASWADPTVRALCRFMFGHALLNNGKVDEAKVQFDFPGSMIPGAVGICTPAIALCKEPSAEHREYLQEVIDLNVNLTAYDEQGYSALDYAVYSTDKKAEKLLKRGLMSQIDFDGTHDALEIAKVRKHFREIFHGQFRPIILMGHSDCIQALRRKYLELLQGEGDKRKCLDWLRVVSYDYFVERQELPRWGMTDDWSTREFAQLQKTNSEEPFLIFFSYRWIGRNEDPKRKDPDSPEKYQYRRMLDALYQVLEIHPKVKQENVYIWLVSYVGIQRDLRKAC